MQITYRQPTVAIELLPIKKEHQAMVRAMLKELFMMPSELIEQLFTKVTSDGSAIFFDGNYESEVLGIMIMIDNFFGGYVLERELDFPSYPMFRIIHREKVSHLVVR